MEITVTIEKILDAQRFVSKKDGQEIVRHGFVGKTDGQYPKMVYFTVLGDDKFNAMSLVVGGRYNVSFDVNSREWNGKWFTDVSAWRCVRTDVQANPVASVVSPVPTTPNVPNMGGSAGETDDKLPF
jgi:hypothetical protein